MEYDASTKAVMRTLGAELMEIEDWTCCGASAGDAASHLLSMVLPARNLALAERSQVDADILVPCSACYLNLEESARPYPERRWASREGQPGLGRREARPTGAKASPATFSTCL